MTDTKVQVLKFGRESFVPVKNGHHSTPISSYGGTALINGKPVSEYQPARGDENFVVVRGTVKSICKRFGPKRTLVHYIAKEEYADLAGKSPISVDEYESLDPVRSGMYEAFYREDPVPDREIAFDVIDIDCKPRQFPPHVMVMTPEYLRRFKNTWHTLPCYITSKGLFLRLNEAVKKERDENPAFRRYLTFTAHENIESIDVSAKFSLKGITGSIGSTILKFHSEGRFGSKFPKIEGENLDDLEKNIAAWIGGFIDQIRAITAPKDCPCCGQKLPKGSDVIYPARR